MVELFISGNCRCSFGGAGEKKQKYGKDQMMEVIKNENVYISLLELRVQKLCLHEEKQKKCKIRSFRIT